MSSITPVLINSAKANAFNIYFHSVFTQDTGHCSSTDYLTPTNTLSKINICNLDVYNSLITLNTTKAMGPDKIPPIVLSKCASALYKPCLLYTK